MDIENVKEIIESIIEKYWNEDEEYYSRYRYEGEDEKEFDMTKEIRDFLENNSIDFEMSEEDGFDSCGYSNDFMAVAYKVNNRSNYGSSLGLNTVVFECM